jgi:hypothetical protein
VTETGLLIAEAAFLVLLYLFVWSIVRSSSRDLRETTPLAAGPAAPAEPAPVSAPAPPAPAPPPPVVPAAAAAVVAEALVPETDVAMARERPTGPAFELSVNIRPRLIVVSSPSLGPGSEYALEAGMTLGRSRSNGIPISDQFASHMHARVFPHGHFFYIEDLGSTNGTFVNGRRIEEQAQLKVHDEIRLGETTLRYEE